MLEQYVFSGQKEGKKLLVLAAIHGNETAGTNAIRRLIKEINEKKLTITSGRLTLVPICNKKAYEKDIRQIDENLNRVMTMHDNPQTYEQTIANEICPLIKENDILLDLHSTHCQDDVPFAFCDYPNPENLQLISVLPVAYVLEGWPQIYANQNDIQDFSTEHAAHIYGNIGTTLECGYHKSAEAIDIAYHSIINILTELDMIQGNIKHTKQQHILMQSYIIKTREGKLLKNYKHLDKIQKGEIIARYNDGENLIAPTDGYILLPNLKAEIGAEWYYLGQKMP